MSPLSPSAGTGFTGLFYHAPFKECWELNPGSSDGDKHYTNWATFQVPVCVSIFETSEVSFLVFEELASWQPFYLFMCFLCLSGPGVWNQGFIHARQAHSLPLTELHPRSWWTVNRHLASAVSLCQCTFLDLHKTKPPRTNQNPCIEPSRNPG